MITLETLKADAREETRQANARAALRLVFVPFGADLAVAPEDYGNAPEVFGEPLASDYTGDGFEPLRGGGRKRACLPSC